MKVGDKVVYIGPSKDYKYNPVAVEGKVVSVTGDYNPIIVLWKTGIRNSYVESQLKKI